jgi:hypothetical protein
MNFLLRQLPLIALITWTGLVQAQTSITATETTAVPHPPLNLSLPRNDVRTVDWERAGVYTAQHEDGTRSGTGNQGSDKEGNTHQQKAVRSGGGMPYGSGFEARQGSRTGGRGMGRGR